MLAIVCFATSGLLSLHFGKDFSWDYQNYHGYNGYAFFHGRLDVDIAPAFLQTYFNPRIDATCYFLSTRLSDRCAGFLLGGLQGVNLWFVFVLIRMFLRPDMGRFLLWLIPLAGMSLALAMPMIRIQTGRMFHDNTASGFVLCSLLLLLRVDGARVSRWQPAVLLLAGLLAGGVAGMKLTNVVFGLGLGLAATTDLVVLPDERSPVAHVVPSFPSGVRFVRIVGLLSYPHNEFGIGKEVREAIRNHKGSIFSFWAARYGEWIRRISRHYTRTACGTLT